MQRPFTYIPPRGPPPSSERQRVLASWRGVDLTPLEVARISSARASKDVVKQVVQRLRLEARLGEAEIVKVWNGIVDPTIRAHAQPVGIQNGTLFVTVDNSVWLDELVRYRRREILERLQNCFGKDKLKKISFRLG